MEIFAHFFNLISFKFDRDGFLVMENFISVEKCNALRNECDRIIDSNHFAEEVSKISVFSAAGNDTEVLAVIYLGLTFLRYN